MRPRSKVAGSMQNYANAAPTAQVGVAAVAGCHLRFMQRNLPNVKRPKRQLEGDGLLLTLVRMQLTGRQLAVPKVKKESSTQLVAGGAHMNKTNKCQRTLTKRFCTLKVPPSLKLLRPGKRSSASLAFTYTLIKCALKHTALAG